MVKWFFMESLLANDDVESTSNLRRKNPGLGNLRRIYVEFTSNLRRIYVESAWNLRRNMALGYGKNLGRAFGGHKKLLREWPQALPRCSQTMFLAL